MKAVKIYGLFFGILAMMPTQIFAHATWDPIGPTPPRANQDIKVGSCGGVTRGNAPLESTPNAIIDIQFKEIILHPGYFTVNFSGSNDENFKLIQRFEKSAIPRDTYLEKLTMPYELCTDCTLQLIQFMTENPASPTFYYSCTDITLTPPNLLDLTKQDPVSNLVAAPGDGSATLNWTNPVLDLNDPLLNFYKVIIVSNTAAITTTPEVELTKKQFKVGEILNTNNDKVEYIGYDTTTIISSLLNGNSYNFKVFAYDINLNYSSAVSTNAIPSTINVAPTVSITVQQGSQSGTTVYKNDTDIVVKASVIDGNPNDTHTYSWTTGSLSDSDNNTTDASFTVSSTDIKLLNTGKYTFSVTATDNGAGNLTGTTSVDITLQEAPTTNSGGLSTNLNGSTSSGGCTISTTAKFDPLLHLLSLLSLIVIGLKFRKTR